MTQPQYIAIDPAALDTLRAEIARLHSRLDAVDMTPRAEWVTIDQLADMIGKSRRTVLRRIDAGQIETRHVAGERLVRVNPGDAPDHRR